MLDNIGIPNSSINLSLSDGSLMSPADGEILISLKEDHQPDRRSTCEQLRKELPQAVPGPDVLLRPGRHRHAGAELRPAGADRRPGRRPACGNVAKNDADRPADRSRDRADSRRGRRAPAAGAAARRTCASTSIARWPARSGVTQQDVASDLLVSLSSQQPDRAELLAEPAERRELQHLRADAAVPDEHDQRSWRTRRSCRPASSPTPDNTQLLGNLATTARAASRRPTSRTTTSSPRCDVLMSVQGTDLGSAAERCRAGRRRIPDQAARAARNITVRGQVESMNDSFTGLALRADLRRRAGLPADGDQLPVAGSTR